MARIKKNKTKERLGLKESASSIFPIPANRTSSRLPVAEAAGRRVDQSAHKVRCGSEPTENEGYGQYRRCTKEIQLSWPVWYFPENPLGSAAKYIASLSPDFNGVEVYRVKRNQFEFAFSIGDFSKTKSKWVVPFRDQKNQVLGEMRVVSDLENAFGPNEKEMIHKVISELEERMYR